MSIPLPSSTFSLAARTALGTLEKEKVEATEGENCF